MLQKALLVAGSVACCLADTTSERKQFFERFHQNPAAAMEEDPKKLGFSSAIPKFTQNQVMDQTYVQEKLAVREQILKYTMLSHDERVMSEQREAKTTAASLRNDRAEDLVDNRRSLLTKPEEMEAKGLKSSKLPVQPWSDDYWAIYMGQLGRRYADRKFMRTYPRTWNNYFEASKEEATSRDVLSPAEKYDLIIGSGFETPSLINLQNRKSYTEKGWEQGERYNRSNDGEVETWMGLCHGWAPAAFMLPRPVRPVTVQAWDGEEVTMYPSDIKALGTSLWAEHSTGVRFIGGRCNAKDVEKDENGRIKSDECRDTNPGTFHKVVVNQIGVSQRSFILDATFDYEVWNQPVLEYEFQYFNVNTQEEAETAAEAAVAVEDYVDDKFAQHRSSRAKKVVGVEMSLTYMVETRPRQRSYDRPSLDHTVTAWYRYDLELDADNNIIGGEWYQNKRPDFLWVPAVRNEPQRDLITERNRNFPGLIDGVWAKGDKIPEVWRAAAMLAAHHEVSPLSLIVDELFKRASEEVVESPADSN